MQTDGKAMHLDRQGNLESPEGDRSFSTPPRREANGTELQELPYGIVPEVYVPWYPQWGGPRPSLPGARPPGAGVRPPRPPRPGGDAPLVRPLPGAAPSGPGAVPRPPAVPNPGQRPIGQRPDYHPGYPPGYVPGYSPGYRTAPGAGRPQGYLPAPPPGGQGLP